LYTGLAKRTLGSGKDGRREGPWTCLMWRGLDRKKSTTMHRVWLRLALVSVAAAGAVTMFAAPAGAHEITDFSLSCSTVSATLTTDNSTIHPVTWNIKVGNGAFQAVTTAETHVGPPDQDVTLVSANIASLTDGLQGQPTIVQAFLSWAALPNGDQNFEATITCGTTPTTTTPPTTSTEPAQVAPASVQRPVAVSPAALAVNASATFTG